MSKWTYLILSLSWTYLLQIDKININFILILFIWVLFYPPLPTYNRLYYFSFSAKRAWNYTWELGTIRQMGTRKSHQIPPPHRKIFRTISFGEAEIISPFKLLNFDHVRPPLQENRLLSPCAPRKPPPSSRPARQLRTVLLFLFNLDVEIYIGLYFFPLALPYLLTLYYFIPDGPVITRIALSHPRR